MNFWIFVFYDVGDWTQGFAFVRQELCHWAISSVPDSLFNIFCFHNTYNFTLLFINPISVPPLLEFPNILTWMLCKCLHSFLSIEQNILLVLKQRFLVFGLCLWSAVAFFWALGTVSSPSASLLLGASCCLCPQVCVCVCVWRECACVWGDVLSSSPRPSCEVPLQHLGPSLHPQLLSQALWSWILSSNNHS